MRLHARRHAPSVVERVALHAELRILVLGVLVDPEVLGRLVLTQVGIDSPLVLRCPPAVLLTALVGQCLLALRLRVFPDRALDTLGKPIERPEVGHDRLLPPSGCEMLGGAKGGRSKQPPLAAGEGRLRAFGWEGDADGCGLLIPVDVGMYFVPGEGGGSSWRGCGAGGDGRVVVGFKSRIWV